MTTPTRSLTPAAVRRALRECDADDGPYVFTRHAAEIWRDDPDAQQRERIILNQVTGWLRERQYDLSHAVIRTCGSRLTFTWHARGCGQRLAERNID